MIKILQLILDGKLQYVNPDNLNKHVCEVLMIAAWPKINNVALLLLLPMAAAGAGAGAAATAAQPAVTPSRIQASIVGKRTSKATMQSFLSTSS